MNIRNLIKTHLKAIGAGGLCTDMCGCGIEDLAPCQGISVLDCKPAKKVKADTLDDDWSGLRDEAEAEGWEYVYIEMENEGGGE
jgi:hypothetical protein